MNIHVIMNIQNTENQGIIHQLLAFGMILARLSDPRVKARNLLPASPISLVTSRI